MGRKAVPWIWRVASKRRRSGWGRLRWRRALESGGNLIVGGGGLWCDSLERGESSFIGSGGGRGGSRTGRVGSRNENSGR
jgi:hypothetical protein